jgi:hypothetical protein
MAVGISILSGKQKKIIITPVNVDTTLPVSPFFEQSPSSQKQDYFQFRSAEHQLANNHSNTLSPFNKSPKYSNHGKMQNLTNMHNEENIQEYRRYRNSKHHTPAKVCV